MIKELLSKGLDMHLKSDKEKATLVNAFVESIAVGHDDKLQVRLNFKTDRDVDAGGEGNRTPVRNHILKSLYGCICLFRIPPV